MFFVLNYLKKCWLPQAPRVDSITYSRSAWLLATAISLQKQKQEGFSLLHGNCRWYTTRARTRIILQYSFHSIPSHPIWPNYYYTHFIPLPPNSYYATILYHYSGTKHVSVVKAYERVHLGLNIIQQKHLMPIWSCADLVCLGALFRKEKGIIPTPYFSIFEHSTTNITTSKSCILTIYSLSHTHTKTRTYTFCALFHSGYCSFCTLHLRQ